MGNEQVVIGIENYIRRGMEQKAKLLDAVRTRLVWFIAISGFAILNGNSIYDSIGKRPLVGYEILIVFIPLLFSALLALLCHFLSDQVEIRSNNYYNNKLVLLELFKAKTTNGRGKVEELEVIINDINPEIIQLRNIADKWTNFTNNVEGLTILFLILGYFWIIIYPLFLII